MSFTLRVDLGTGCDSHVPHSHFIYQEISEEIVLPGWCNIPRVHVLNDPVCSLDACGAGANSPGHWGVGVVLLIISVRNGYYHLKPFQQGRLFDCGWQKVFAILPLCVPMVAHVCLEVVLLYHEDSQGDNECQDK